MSQPIEQVKTQRSETIAAMIKKTVEQEIKSTMVELYMLGKETKKTFSEDKAGIEEIVNKCSDAIWKSLNEALPETTFKKRPKSRNWTKEEIELMKQLILKKVSKDEIQGQFADRTGKAFSRKYSQIKNKMIETGILPKEVKKESTNSKGFEITPGTTLAVPIEIEDDVPPRVEKMVLHVETTEPLTVPERDSIIAETTSKTRFESPNKETSPSKKKKVIPESSDESSDASSSDSSDQESDAEPAKLPEYYFENNVPKYKQERVMNHIRLHKNNTKHIDYVLLGSLMNGLTQNEIRVIVSIQLTKVQQEEQCEDED